MQNRIQKYIMFSMMLWWGNADAHQESILMSDRQMQDIIVSRKACPCDECTLQRAQFEKKNAIGEFKKPKKITKRGKK